MPLNSNTEEKGKLVQVPGGLVTLEGNLALPHGALGLVLFAHGSGSSRHSPRNRAVAGALRNEGLGTLLIDLLTPEEEAVDDRTARLRFDIGLLAERLVGATDWLSEEKETRMLHVGYFGASTGAGAALVAAAQRPNAVRAVVSRGGRPDLAGAALSRGRSSCAPSGSSRGFWTPCRPANAMRSPPPSPRPRKVSRTAGPFRPRRRTEAAPKTSRPRVTGRALVLRKNFQGPRHVRCEVAGRGGRSPRKRRVA